MDLIELIEAFLAAKQQTPRHMMLERGTHPNWAKTVTLENETVDTGPIPTAFGGSMARKEAERNTRYG
jgi:hypothetical protein